MFYRLSDYLWWFESMLFDFQYVRKCIHKLDVWEANLLILAYVWQAWLRNHVCQTFLIFWGGDFKHLNLRFSLIKYLLNMLCPLSLPLKIKLEEHPLAHRKQHLSMSFTVADFKCLIYLCYWSKSIALISNDNMKKDMVYILTIWWF